MDYAFMRIEENNVCFKFLFVEENKRPAGTGKCHFYLFRFHFFYGKFLRKIVAAQRNDIRFIIGSRFMNKKEPQDDRR